MVHARCCHQCRIHCKSSCVAPDASMQANRGGHRSILKRVQKTSINGTALKIDYLTESINIHYFVLQCVMILLL